MGAVSYVCPKAVKDKRHNFILCGAKMEEGKSYIPTVEALKVFCPHQKYCSCASGAVNTEEAKKCKLRIEN